MVNFKSLWSRHSARPPSAPDDQFDSFKECKG
jgi:hypothetical protein